MFDPITVLIVDDSIDDAFLLERALQHSDFEARTFRVDNKDDMTRYLHEHRVDVVLADYNLPNFSALGALEVLRMVDEELPLIVVSGNLGEETAIQLMREGARDYIMKDNLARLGSAVGREVAEARIRRAKRRAEGETLIAARLWQETFDSISDMVLVMDVHHRILQANRSAREVFKGEIIGRHCFEVVHGTSTVPSGCVHILCLQTGQPEHREYCETNLGGRWFDARIFPIRDDRGRVVRVVHTFRDITARKHAEDELVEKEQQLRQMDKLQAIGQLAGGIAHDFNNQLTGIMGYADILTMRVQDPVLLNCAQEIVKAASRSADLTAKLLAFSRKGNFMTTSIDLNALLNEVAGILRHSLDKRISIVVSAVPQRLIMTGDHTQIQSALLNLCINSRDAMPDGGTLTLTTEVVALNEEQAEVSELAPGQYALISVTDTGEGISPDIYGRIFDPFFTTKPVGKGTGLGLSAVYGTVKAHHGALDFSSKIGSGTTFRLYLPLDSEIVARVDRESSFARGSGHIVVIDDEQTIRAVTADLLRELGYKVTPFESGAEALAYYKDNWEKVDLILLDIILREASGIEVFHQIRAINPHARVILASGYSMNLDISEILATGSAGFIQKPFHHSELSWRIHEALAKSVTPAKE